MTEVNRFHYLWQTSGGLSKLFLGLQGVCVVVQQARKLQATIVRNSAHPLTYSLTGVRCRVGRVEKSKNGINSYGYCFLVAFWYVETRKNIFFGQRKFFVGWNLT